MVQTIVNDHTEAIIVRRHHEVLAQCYDIRINFHHRDIYRWQVVVTVFGERPAAQTNQGDPNAGIGYELDVIAAAVIGGTSLAGGRGSISGTIVGTMIMGVLTNILGLNNVDSNVQMMIKAVIIILAVRVQLYRTET